jgi:hypothetical protein
MPWKAKDAKASTQKAQTPSQKRQWAHVANAVLERTGDEGRAKREANAVMARGRAKR